MSTLTPTLKVVCLSYLYILRYKPCIFYYWVMSVRTGSWECARLYLTRAELFIRVSVMSNIHAYITVWRGHWHAWVTGKRNSLAGFPLFPRYRCLLTIAIGMYWRMLILMSYPLQFESMWFLQRSFDSIPFLKNILYLSPLLQNRFSPFSCMLFINI